MDEAGPQGTEGVGLHGVEAAAPGEIGMDLAQPVLYTSVAARGSVGPAGAAAETAAVGRRG